MPSKKEYTKDKIKYRKESLDYYLEHREERDIINKEWVKNNPEKSKIIKATYRGKHKEKIKKQQIIYRKGHKVELSEQRKKWKRDNPEKVKNQRFKLTYGITYEDYLEILRGQENRCGICLEEFKDFYKFPDLRSPCIDHCHSKKEVRGVLCRGCNSGMGFLNDSPSLLKAALLWLTKKEYHIIFEKNWYQKIKIKEFLYNKISKDQNNKCGICKKDLSGVRVHLDHNHFSMRVRGFLCVRCNKALGFLKDDLEIIRNSIKWLTKSRHK